VDVGGLESEVGQDLLNDLGLLDEGDEGINFI
jgi:hypothetical protein